MTGRVGIMQTMLLPARPTLRCLREDLLPVLEGHALNVAARIDRRVQTFDRNDGSTMTEVDHPIVDKARAVFPVVGEVEAQRESLTSAKGHPWWKLKSGEWRGAAHEDESTGQAWICASGLKRDFYDGFSRRIGQHGHEYFLPTDEDRKLLKRDRAAAILAIWDQDNHSAALDALDQATAIQGSAYFEIMHPVEGRSLSTVEVQVFRIDEADGSVVELTVVFSRDTWEDVRLLKRAEEVVLLAIDPQEQDWRPGSPSSGKESIFSQVISNEPFEQFRARARLSRRPAETSPGSHSHYTGVGDLTRKTIFGEAVEALCGTWFVPRQDHVSLPTCPTCASAYSSLPA